MHCSDNHDLYIEEEPRFTGEDYGWYVVMCYECGWCDKMAVGSYDAAVIRLAELKGAAANVPPTAAAQNTADTVE